MFFSFEVCNPTKKLLTASIMTFISGAVLSAMIIKKGLKTSDKKKETVTNSMYYEKVLNRIETILNEEKLTKNRSLKGIRIFIVKENDFIVKNIIKLYFCDEENENWEEFVSQKDIKINTLTQDIKKKLKNLKMGEEIEITDMIFR